MMGRSGGAVIGFVIVLAASVLFLRVAWAARARARGEAPRDLVAQSEVDRLTQTCDDQRRWLDGALLERRHLLRDLSHDLRTQMTLFVGSVSFLRDAASSTTSGPADVSRHLDRLSAVAARLEALVHQVDAVADLEVGGLHLDLRATDLTDLVGRLVMSFAPEAERREIYLRRQIPGSGVLARVDPDLLRRALVQLVSDVFKSCPSGSQVTIGLRTPEPPSTSGPGRVTLFVQDDGPGIAPSDLEALAQGSRRRAAEAPEGAPAQGRGLLWAREIFRLHGATLRHSTRQGVGSTFSIDLPTVTPDAHAAEGEPPSATEVDGAMKGTERGSKSPEPSAEGPARLRERVLVVEDHAGVRALVREILSAEYDVIEAVDARDGVAKAHATGPAAIICDVRMPHGGGEALLQALRAEETEDYVPVLLLSAGASAEDRVRGLRWGAADYLTKPFSAEELLARVAGMIASQERKGRRQRVPLKLDNGALTQIPSEQEAFVQRLHDVVEANLSRPDFDVDELSRLVGYSRSALYRRLAASDLETAADMIRRLRLERGRALLEKGVGSVSKVALMCGFSNTAHFSRLFRQEFGKPPSSISPVPVGRSKGTAASPEA